MQSVLHQFDRHLTVVIQGWPAWLHGYMNWVTWIGQPVITLLIVIAIGVYAALHGMTRLGWAAVVAGVTFGINSLLKLLIQRARPDTEYVRTTLLDTYSFPSGHAASSVVIFGLVALIAWHALPLLWAIVAVMALVVLIVSIGLSRVYLGAHYPSDVLIGWIVGSIGLAVIIWWVRPFA